MASQQVRQGSGARKTVTAIGPEARADGTPLQKSEVAHFEFDLEYQGGLSVAAMPVQLSDDPNTPEWDGSFSEEIDIDSHAPGVYTLVYRTVDVDGRASVDSAPFSLEILPPLQAPNPPTNIA